MTKLILTRHGQSVWNAENRFTGWVDVDLSNKGVQEAEKSGQLIKELKIKIDVSYTSYLKRAIKTLTTILKINNLELKFNTAWQLNERHYGSFTGLNNEETKKKQDVNKKLVFWSLPNIMVLTLKRFTNSNSKNNTTVDFPLENLTT